MKEKALEAKYHEREKLQPKFNTPKKNKRNQNGIDIKIVPIEHLRSYAILRCGSINQFSQKLGVGRAMGSKILSGNYIPQKISTIEKISEVLGINPTIVTRIFNNLQNEKT